MQKLVGHLGEHLPPSVLYYDDIEKLVDILAESNSEVTIETKDFRLSGIAELKELKNNVIRELTITSAKPKVSISFTSHHTWLFAYEDTPSAKGLFEKIKQYVLSKRKRLTWAQNPLVGFALGSLAWLFPMVAGKNFINRGVFIVGLLAICGLWMWWVVEGKFKMHSTIYPLQERHLSSGFLAQNKDKMIVALISAVVGSLITITMNKLLK